MRDAPPRSVDSRRLLEALRLLTLVQTVDADDAALVDQLQDCVARLRLAAGPGPGERIASASGRIPGGVGA